MRRWLCVAVGALVAGCASPPATLTDLGGNAYRMTKRDNFLSGKPNELREKVEFEALAHCKAQNRALAVLDSRVVDPSPPEFASATMTFRCVPINP